MPKISVYIATSLDGFIARKNGDIDWLPTDSPDGEDYGYAEFMSTVDALVMGRNSFEKVLSFGGWPYDRKVFVLSSKTLTISPDLSDKVEALHLPPRELIQELEQRGVKHIYLDGGVTIQRFLREGLVDEMTLTSIPILIGEGLPLFGALEKDIPLKLLEARSFPNGMVQRKYRLG